MQLIFASRVWLPEDIFIVPLRTIKPGHRLMFCLETRVNLLCASPARYRFPTYTHHDCLVPSMRCDFRYSRPLYEEPDNLGAR